MYCNKCGNRLNSDDSFCTKCGTIVSSANNDHQKKNIKNGKKKGKIITIIIITIISLLVLVGIMIFVVGKNSYTKRSKNIEFYDSLNEFSKFYGYNIYNLKVIGENVNDAWYHYVYNSSYKSVDDAIEHGLKESQDSLNNISNSKTKLYNAYIKVQVAECFSSYCDEIKQQSKELYNIYMELYETVSSPTGTYKQYSEKYNDLISKQTNQSIKQSNSILLFGNENNIAD